MFRGSDALKNSKIQNYLFPRFKTSALVLSTVAGLAALVSPAIAAPATVPTSLFPRLHAGQTFTYLVQYRMKKNTKTESRVVTPAGPQDTEVDAQWLLYIEVLDVHPQDQRFSIHARSQIQSVDSALSPKNAGGQISANKNPAASEAKSVEFTILPDGRTQSVTGLDALFPEQRQAWDQWLRQFAIAGIFPRDGVKPHQSWKTIEDEQAPSLITRLQWDKKSTYVRDELCSPAELSENGSAPAPAAKPETCAVVLTQAVLKQKSPLKDTTPGDFRLHALHTTGTARGTNETISYISLQTGLIVRVTEDAKQLMDVLVVKSDGSNQIHYNIAAASHTEVLLLAPAR